MTCGCQKKGGSPQKEPTTVRLKTEGGTSPTDQCLYCAGKHLCEAWGCYHEYGYRRDDLRQIQSSLRLLVLHTFKSWPQLAKLARDCAVIIQKADFTAFEKRLDELCRLYDDVFAKAEPEVEAKRAAAEAVCDIIIPLGSGSVHGNDELRFLLRSIEENAVGVGRVILATDCAPDWINPETVLISKSHDSIANNKDANLINKTIKAIEDFGVKSMTWCADDNTFLKPVRLSRIPTLYNHRSRADFEGGGRWRERVLNTFAWAEAKGVKLEHCLESHAPQTFMNCDRLVELAKAEDIIKTPVTVMTFFHVLLGTWSGNAAGLDKQEDWKDTAEGLGNFATPTKVFLGYNDAGLSSGLHEWLMRRFNKKSRFEK